MHENELRPDAPAARIQTFKAISDDLELEIRRDEIMSPYDDALAAIGDEDKRKLFSKSRPLIAEIGLPLRSKFVQMRPGTMCIMFLITLEAATNSKD